MRPPPRDPFAAPRPFSAPFCRHPARRRHRARPAGPRRHPIPDERAALGPNQTDTIFGTGVTQMDAVLAELRRQKFDGNLAIEYEFNWHHSVPDIAQCIGFVRGWAAAEDARR